jgi:hypothetical protein
MGKPILYRMLKKPEVTEESKIIQWFLDFIPSFINKGQGFERLISATQVSLGTGECRRKVNKVIRKMVNAGYLEVYRNPIKR